VKLFICWVLVFVSWIDKLNPADSGGVVAGALTIEPSRTLTKILNRGVPAVITAKVRRLFYSVHSHTPNSRTLNFVRSTLTIFFLAAPNQL
jgi:hypothetical protein